MKSESLAKIIVDLLESKKAEEITLIDVRKKVDYADFFIICSSRSTKHAQGICEFISLELEKLDIKPLGIEGLELGQWIVMDYETVILHIFYEPIRKIYALEELWGDFPPRKRQENFRASLSQE
ncbi:iojap-like protein [Thermodesulfobacterium geofontis OPF15]|jgi:ribosome-associated protein|uniref:Ribosomal silencing factor RsfS n=1 Tax=Thermodesulfobacterium geofontis (strain OPF15) TaxID=795359 RepID=F8C4U4_THEGP|nr:ribosome silencing factor [Thermodesulfobacterium geofontis]AEH23459.1 iojap-like protein [Thermodesulfobacterium geofontis OPF15]